MPYTVKNKAPVYQDARRTLKIGHTSGAQTFISLEYAHDSLRADQLLVFKEAVNGLSEEREHRGVWVKFSDCEKIEAPIEPPTSTGGGALVYTTSEQEALEALKTLARFLKAI